MEIGVLSGKGGTGKTFVSTNMARVVADSYYIDCDVEEPNGYLFFDENNIVEEDVYVKIPRVDKELCNGCKKCVELCKFNALSYVGDSLLTFDDICHSCGACSLFCPENAIREVDRSIGRIVKAEDGDTKIHTGVMDIGQASGGEIIDSLLDSVKELDNTKLIDCPPGTACSVMDSIKNTDYCLIVVEPTIFGLHNFKMVEELVRLFSKPFSVVINKSFGENTMIVDYCQENNIDILLEIPFDKELGDINSRGKLIVDESEKYKEIFEKLYLDIKRRVEDEKTTHP